MIKLLLCLFLSITSVSAQDITEAVDFLDTKDTATEAFTVPVYMELDGTISLISRNGAADFSMAPMAQVFWTNAISKYIYPVPVEYFGLEEQKSHLGWIKVHRRRIEGGLGLASLVGQFVGVGFNAYKGANTVEVRHLENQKQKLKTPNVPKRATDIDGWKDGDSGLYQTYGGVQVSLGLNYYILTILEGKITFQNQFEISVKKLSSKRVQVTISEEDFTKRNLKSGFFAAKAEYAQYKGKKFLSTFMFNIEDARERKLYEAALAGKINEVQEKLAPEKQRVEWKGTQKLAYVGVPSVAGKYFVTSEYVIDSEGEEEETVDIKSRMNAGLLLPKRDHRQVVFQNDDGIMVYWFSLMNKALESSLEKRFLLPGKIIGVQGFMDAQLGQGKLGSTLTQLGIHFTKEELTEIQEGDLPTLLDSFRDRCIEFKLKCRKDRTFRKISKKLHEFLGKDWKEVRDELGFLLIEQPALIHAYVKTMNMRKEVYFKFLSERYQSMEGTAAVEI